MSASGKFNELAFTSTRTWPGPGRGGSTSSTFRFSMGPNSRQRSAFTLPRNPGTSPRVPAADGLGDASWLRASLDFERDAPVDLDPARDLVDQGGSDPRPHSLSTADRLPEARLVEAVVDGEGSGRKVEQAVSEVRPQGKQEEAGSGARARDGGKRFDLLARHREPVARGDLAPDRSAKILVARERCLHDTPTPRPAS